MTKHAPRVLLVGYGQMGHAMRVLLAPCARLVVWRVTPQRQVLGAAMRATLAASDFVILCVPTLALAPLLARIMPCAARHAVYLSFAKGLDDAGCTAADILEARLGARGSWGVLGGPMIAAELSAGRHGYAEMGTRSITARRATLRLFRATPLHVADRASQPRAVSWCGVLKNIYTPLFGLADGLGWGDNVRGRLASTALDEINRLVERLTGTRRAAAGAAGLSDLITTATSKSSHHRMLGRRVARGDYSTLRGEGPHSVRVLQRRHRLPGAQAFPLLAVATALVSRPRTVRTRLHTWLKLGV
ncbi:MAG TPA: hypothetical protein VJS89_07210 [Gammaproteobacteria bacterium]|nr:hypothetical protein [Gammaproteobacteria bacterium]